nr:orf355 [Zancudomyces culisetae]AAW49502.1 orf355 [Zancudomyces culisetae]
VFIIAPALNLAICWKFLIFIGQSARNLINLDLLEIFRDYTPQFIYCNELIIIKNLLNKNSNQDKRYYIHKENKDIKEFNENFSYYLAGLIEGDGTIIVPKTERSNKGRINYPSIQIVFNSKDLPLALIIQKNLGLGSISKTKGVNAYRLTINNYEGLIKLTKLLNGKFKTVKIYYFNELIKFLNNRFSNFNILPMELNQTPFYSNSWLSGFIDADGHFNVSLNKNSVSCRFELVQAIEDKRGNDKKDIMIKLAEYLNKQLKIISKSYCNSKDQYNINITNLESNLIISNYLLKYPLFSSKFLNFKDYYKVLILIKNKEHKSLIAKEQIYSIKNQMNNKRTIFTWDHLQNFYNLYK